MKPFKYFLSMTILTLLMAGFISSAQAASMNEIEVVMFTRNGCVHCAAMKAKLSALQQNGFPQIKLVEYEIFTKPENQQLFEQCSKAFGVTIVGVPVTIIGDQFIEGEDTEQLEALIRGCQQKICPTPTELLKNLQPSNTNSTSHNQAATIVGWLIIGALGASIIGYITYKIIKRAA